MKLQYRIIVLLLAILLVGGLVAAAVSIYYQRQSAVTEFKKSAVTLSEMLGDRLEHNMILGDQSYIQDAVMRIAGESMVQEAVVFGGNQTVYASGEISQVGQSLNDTLVAQAITSGQTVTETKGIYEGGDFSVIMPLLNKPECHTCHGTGATVLGATKISLDTSTLNAAIRKQGLTMILISLLTLAGVGIAVALALRSTVVNPLSRLASSARQIAQGNFHARVNVEREDEVGMMARTFNEMAEHVEEYAHALENSKTELEEKVQARTKQLQEMATVRGQLVERCITVQEEERQRLARELHDEAGQDLSAIIMGLSRAMDTLPEDAAAPRERLTQLRSVATQTLAELRKLVYDLRPDVLDQLGLVPALRSFVRSRLEKENIKVELSIRGLKTRLAPKIEAVLFRVIQEAITNIIRHSGASTVTIQLAATDTAVTGSIEDNGKGFDVEGALEKAGSWGLRGMHERITIAGGQMDIASQPGQGTRITFQLPLATIEGK